MKTFFSAIIIATLFACLPQQTANAQFGKFIDKAMDVLEEKVNTDTKSKKDSEKESSQTKTKTSNPSTSGTDANGKTATPKVKTTDKTVEVETESEIITISESDEKPTNVQASPFIGSFTMTISDLGQPANKAKKNPPIVTTCFVDSYQYASFMDMPGEEKEMDKVRVIVDRKENTQTILTENNGEKKGFKSKRPNVDVRRKNGKPEEAPKVTKTSKNRTIDGYLCYLYTVETKDDLSEIWVTNALDINMLDIYGSDKRMNAKMTAYSEIKGFPIENMITDKKDGTQVLMKVSNIKKGLSDKSMFSTEGYEIMDRGSLIPGQPSKNPPPKPSQDPKVRTDRFGNPVPTSPTPTPKPSQDPKAPTPDRFGRDNPKD